MTIHVKLLTIRGRVQGVGYRYSMVEKAQLLGIAGWVRNRTDGGNGYVEALVCGTLGQIAALREWARQGPPGACVDHIECIEAECPESTPQGFVQKPTY